jgi:hypothetical protein
MEANQLMADYARRTLPENLGRYTYYISTSLREALRLQIPWTWPLLAVASMAALLVLATSGSPVPLRHLALTCLGMGLLHAGHMLLCSATCLLIPRYQAITATPWLVSCILLVGGGLKVASRRSWLTTSSARTPR